MLEYCFHSFHGISKFQAVYCWSSCLFVHSEGANLAIVAVYDDGLIIVSRTPEVMKNIKNDLSRQFKKKYLGKIHYCMGITVEYDKQRSCLQMHQRQYIVTLLERYRLSAISSFLNFL